MRYWSISFFRSDILKGELTYEDVFAIMPWNNTIDRVTMKGYELIEILEDALSILSEDDNSYKDDFLQVSGIKMTVLVLNENAGNRIQTLKTLCSIGR